MCRCVLCACVMQPFPKLPVPSWQLGASVGLDEFKRVTDTYYKALEPARKLRTQTLPAQVRARAVRGAKFGSAD